jgi:MutL C terminal dimerisation domain
VYRGDQIGGRALDNLATVFLHEAVVKSARATLESGRGDWQQQFRAPALQVAPPPGPVDVAPACDLPHVVTGAGDSVLPLDQLWCLSISTRRTNGSCSRGFVAAWRRRAFRRKGLLLPQTFDLWPRDAEWVERNAATLQKMGIGIEAFGRTRPRSTAFRFFEDVRSGAFMREVIDGLKSVNSSSAALRLGEDMIAQTVCRQVVKADQPIRYLEIENLIRDLLDCDLS